jgi:alpha-tubulin suppressor-like RCC1 family protein
MHLHTLLHSPLLLLTATAATEQFVSKDSKHKLLETFSDVRFSAVACGKNHTVALEAAPGRRLFSWGFGKRLSSVYFKTVSSLCDFGFSVHKCTM